MSRHLSPPTNQELINELIKLGNHIESTRITGETREERLKNLWKFTIMANVIKIPAKVSLHKLFREISRELGFSDEDIDNYAMDVLNYLINGNNKGLLKFTKIIVIAKLVV